MASPFQNNMIDLDSACRFWRRCPNAHTPLNQTANDSSITEEEYDDDDDGGSSRKDVGESIDDGVRAQKLKASNDSPSDVSQEDKSGPSKNPNETPTLSEGSIRAPKKERPKAKKSAARGLASEPRAPTCRPSPPRPALPGRAPSPAANSKGSPVANSAGGRRTSEIRTPQYFVPPGIDPYSSIEQRVALLRAKRLERLENLRFQTQVSALLSHLSALYALLIGISLDVHSYNYIETLTRVPPGPLDQIMPFRGISSQYFLRPPSLVLQSGYSSSPEDSVIDRPARRENPQIHSVYDTDQVSGTPEENNAENEPPVADSAGHQTVTSPVSSIADSRSRGSSRRSQRDSLAENADNFEIFFDNFSRGDTFPGYEIAGRVRTHQNATWRAYRRLHRNRSRSSSEKKRISRIPFR